MYVVTEEGIKYNMTVETLVEKVNNWGAKVIKVIENPEDDTELRVYVDNFMFINCWDVKEITTEEKILILKNVDCENLLYMKDKKWQETLYWATNRYDFMYLTWDTRLDDWWEDAPKKIKDKWTKQYKALLNTKCFLS